MEIDGRWKPVNTSPTDIPISHAISRFLGGGLEYRVKGMSLTGIIKAPVALSLSFNRLTGDCTQPAGSIEWGPWKKDGPGWPSKDFHIGFMVKDKINSCVFSAPSFVRATGYDAPYYTNFGVRSLLLEFRYKKPNKFDLRELPRTTGTGRGTIKIDLGPVAKGGIIGIRNKDNQQLVISTESSYINFPISEVRDDVLITTKPGKITLTTNNWGPNPKAVAPTHLWSTGNHVLRYWSAYPVSIKFNTSNNELGACSFREDSWTFRESEAYWLTLTYTINGTKYNIPCALSRHPTKSVIPLAPDGWVEGRISVSASHACLGRGCRPVGFSRISNQLTLILEPEM